MNCHTGHFCFSFSEKIVTFFVIGPKKTLISSPTYTFRITQKYIASLFISEAESIFTMTNSLVVEFLLKQYLLDLNSS